MDYNKVFSDTEILLETIKKADKLTCRVHGKEVYLERALFFSWWCEKGTCAFCYMSTQKEGTRKSKARRRRSSLLAEAELIRRIDWRVGFLSGGYGAYDLPEIREIAGDVKEITGEPLWLNIGALGKQDLSAFGDEVVGVVGAVETLNRSLRARVCPGKPLNPIVEMFEAATEAGLKKGMTLILGLGERVEDLPMLMEFIRENKIHKVTVYSLNPHKGTPYANSPPPPSLYQAGVIASLRLCFPDLEISAGTWIDQLPNIGLACLSGATGITKYPLYRMFGNRFGMKVEEEIRSAGRTVVGTFTDLGRLDEAPLNEGVLSNPSVLAAYTRYVNKIKKNVER